LIEFEVKFSHKKSNNKKPTFEAFVADRVISKNDFGILKVQVPIQLRF